MSSRKNRDPGEQKAAANNALLDELDSLKDLLHEQEQELAGGARIEEDIPLLDEAIEEFNPHQTGPLPESAIPVLEEVAYPDEGPASAPLQRDAAKPLPSEEELAKLIDMLIGHRLRRLRPKIKQEVLEELQRLYPDLNR